MRSRSGVGWRPTAVYGRSAQQIFRLMNWENLLRRRTVDRGAMSGVCSLQSGRCGGGSGEIMVGLDLCGSIKCPVVIKSEILKKKNLLLNFSKKENLKKKIPGISWKKNSQELIQG